MTVINTNVKSLIAANALKVNGRAMANAMEQLSTGSRINSAADDAAGLAVTQSMSAQIRGLNMAVRNANDGISLAQTAEGAMVEISNMLQRMRELAVQSANGTINDTQRGYLDTEFKELSTQIDQVIDNTSWNGIKLLDKSNNTNAGTFIIQSGPGSGADNQITITIDTLKPTGGLTDAAALRVHNLYIPLGNATEVTSTDNADGKANIRNVANASSAITTLNGALNVVNGARASLGAVINRLTSVGDNLTNISQNLSESRSRILDTDYAAATTELARTQIIQQAGTAVLAQANQQPQSVLALLR
jgi:flagellin